MNKLSFSATFVRFLCWTYTVIQANTSRRPRLCDAKKRNKCRRIWYVTVAVTFSRFYRLSVDSLAADVSDKIDYRLLQAFYCWHSIVGRRKTNTIMPGNTILRQFHCSLLHSPHYLRSNGATAMELNLTVDFAPSDDVDEKNMCKKLRLLV